VENRLIRPGKTIGDAYYDANLPVVRQRLYRAGVRLAAVLNETLGDIVTPMDVR
jgi:hypothetical protein